MCACIQPATFLNFPLGAWEQSTYMVNKNWEPNVGQCWLLLLPQHSLTERWWRGMKGWKGWDEGREGSRDMKKDEESEKQMWRKMEDSAVEKRGDEETVNPEASLLLLFSFSFEWLIQHRPLLNANMLFLSPALQMSMWPAYICPRLTHILQSWVTSRPSIWAWTRTGPSSQTTIGMKTLQHSLVCQV